MKLLIFQFQWVRARIIALIEFYEANEFLHKPEHMVFKKRTLRNVKMIEIANKPGCTGMWKVTTFSQQKYADPYQFAFHTFIPYSE